MSSTPPNAECGDPSVTSSSKSLPAKQRKLIETSIWNQQCCDSKIEKIKFHHLWIINNISYHCMEADQNHVLYSSVFSSPNDDTLKMSLKLSLFDLDEQKQNNYFINLRINNCEREELVLHYSIFTLNSDGDFGFESINSREKISKNNGNNFDCKEYYFFDAEYTRDVFDTPGDVLTILCEICYEDVVKDSADHKKIALAHLKKDFAQLSNKTKETRLNYDVDFLFGQMPIELPAHKAILSARSEVFADMFEHAMREKIQLEMKDVDGHTGLSLWDYLYENLKVLYDVPDKLLSIADKYQLHSLKSMCEGALCFRINPESVVSLLMLADMHNAELLKLKCIEYIHCYASSVVERKSMNDLMQSRPELCYELFNHTPQISLSSWSPPTFTGDPSLTSWSYTGSRVLKCSHRWTIDNFKANNLSTSRGGMKLIPKCYESPLFPFDKSNNNSSVQFYVQLYTRDESDKYNHQLSLFLHLKCEETMKVACKVRFSILANENSEKGDTEKEFDLSQNFIMTKGSKRGWSKFISHYKLRENNYQLLTKDGRLVVLCEVSYIEDIDKLEIKSGLNTFAHEHEFRIADDLSKFYESQKLTDAVFVLSSKEFKVHRSIVSARSEVFAKMFSSTNRVQIDNAYDVDAFERILALVYGQTNGLNQWALKMLPLLDKFELDSLKQVCQLALCDQLDEKNVVEYLMLADKHKTTLLKSKAIEYIRSKHYVLKQNDALRALQQDNLKLFNEVLCYKLVNWNE